MYQYLVNTDGSINLVTKKADFFSRNPPESDQTVVTDEQLFDTETYLYRNEEFVEDATLATQKASNNVRTQRNLRLKEEVDPILSNPLRWADITTEQQNAWSQYRTDLLNVPQQAGFPHNVTWPTKPAE